MAPEDKELVERLRKLSAENKAPRDCIDEAAEAIERLSVEVEAERNSALTRAKQVAELGEELTALRAQIAVDCCITHHFSSRMCEKGTKGCNVRHAQIAEAQKQEPIAEVCTFGDPFDERDGTWIRWLKSDMRKPGTKFFLHPAADAKDAALKQARAALVCYDFANGVPQAAVAAIDAAMKGG